MPSLTVTPHLRAAIHTYNNLPNTSLPSRIPEDTPSLPHTTIRTISLALTSAFSNNAEEKQKYTLTQLLKGTSIYIPPPPPKPEPTAEYKALMARLRREQEEREYARMLAGARPADPATTTATAGSIAGPAQPDESWDDPHTLAAINSQLSVVLNVVLSTIATGVAVWLVAKGWDEASRVGLAFTAGLTVCIAEVVVFGGYVGRVDRAKEKEKKKKEVKSVVKVWGDGDGEGIDELRETKKIR